MSVIFQLPDVLCDIILSDWLRIQAVGFLDSAVCSNQWRPEFLRLLKGVGRISNAEMKHRTMGFLDWLTTRNVRLFELVWMKFRKEQQCKDAVRQRSILTDIVGRNPQLQSLVLEVDEDLFIDLVSYCRQSLEAVTVKGNISSAAVQRVLNDCPQLWFIHVEAPKFYLKYHKRAQCLNLEFFDDIPEIDAKFFESSKLVELTWENGMLDAQALLLSLCCSTLQKLHLCDTMLKSSKMRQIISQCTALRLLKCRNRPKWNELLESNKLEEIDVRCSINRVLVILRTCYYLKRFTAKVPWPRKNQVKLLESRIAQYKYCETGKGLEECTLDAQSNIWKLWKLEYHGEGFNYPEYQLCSEDDTSDNDYDAGESDSE